MYLHATYKKIKLLFRIKINGSTEIFTNKIWKCTVSPLDLEWNHLNFDDFRWPKAENIDDSNYQNYTHCRELTLFISASQLEQPNFTKFYCRKIFKNLQNISKYYHLQIK